MTAPRSVKVHWWTASGKSLCRTSDGKRATIDRLTTDHRKLNCVNCHNHLVRADEIETQEEPDKSALADVVGEEKGTK